MIKDGLVDRWGIQEFYGMHNMPGYPTGSHFAIREGGDDGRRRSVRDHRDRQGRPCRQAP
jgi:metal-dependent amidase/aminoacylase/carboxypeptidase family protein